MPTKLVLSYHFSFTRFNCSKLKEIIVLKRETMNNGSAHLIYLNDNASKANASYLKSKSALRSRESLWSRTLMTKSTSDFTKDMKTEKKDDKQPSSKI